MSQFSLLSGWRGQNIVGSRAARYGGESCQVYPAALGAWTCWLSSYSLSDRKMASRDTIREVSQCGLSERMNRLNLSICCWGVFFFQEKIGVLYTNTWPIVWICSFRVILDGYLKKAVGLVVEASNKKNGKPTTCNSERWMQQQCRTYYRLAHYADALYRSYEHRLTSSEWQAALRLRQHKVNASLGYHRLTHCTKL